MDNKDLISIQTHPEFQISQAWAAIDIGSNSTLLLIAEKNWNHSLENLKLKPILEQTKTTRLAAGLSQDGKMNQQSMSETLHTILDYYKTCTDLGIPPDRIVVNGTFALRQAENSEMFRTLLFENCGLQLQIISPKREAELVWLAASSGLSISTFPGLVFDIGGGSTEIIVYEAPGKQLKTVSMPLGCLKLTEKFALDQEIGPQARAALFTEIRQKLKVVEKISPNQPLLFLIGVGGTMTSLVSMRKKLKKYDSSLIHGSEVNIDDVSEIFHYLWDLKPDERRQVAGLSPKRAEIILPGLAICLVIMEQWRMAAATVSTWGLRHGILLDIH